MEKAPSVALSTTNKPITIIITGRSISTNSKMKCPYCAKAIATKRGLTQHIASSMECTAAKFAAVGCKRKDVEDSVNTAGLRRSKRMRSNDIDEANANKTTNLGGNPGPNSPPNSDQSVQDSGSEVADFGLEDDTSTKERKCLSDSETDDTFSLSSTSEDDDTIATADGSMLSGDELAPDEESSPAKPKDLRPNRAMLAEFRQYCEEARKLVPLTNQQVTSIKLLDLMKRKKTSLNAYEDFMEWHLKESNVIRNHEGLADARGYTGREALMKELAVRCNMNMGSKFPKTRQVKLPHSKAVVTIVYHEATDIITSLLTDPRIKDEDYAFHDNNPLATPPHTCPIIGDMNTARAYLDTHKALIKEENEVLLPTPIYIDGTATGQFSYLPVIAVKVWLGIFTRKARDNEYAWRTLGYVAQVRESRGRGKRILADSGHLASHDHCALRDGEGDLVENSDEEVPVNPEEEEKTAAIKAQDFHTQLDHILEGYVELQHTGFIWDLVYRKKLWRGIKFVLYVPFVKCDTEEGDLLCGKYLSRGRGVKHVCRYCYCPMTKADDPRAKYPMKSQQKIKKLIDRKELDRLKGISQQCIDNCWYKVRFHKANDRGIHGACPSEMLHALLLGLFKYTRDIFFRNMGPTSQCADDINGLSQIYGKLLSRQSDRSIPYTNFTKGIQEGKVMAKRFRGVLLVMAATLRSTKGRELLFRKKKFKKETGLSDWVLLVETLLEWEAYLCQKEMRRDDVVRLEKKHRVIMYIMKTVAKRSKGMGLKIIKYHAVVHMVEEILLYGVPGEVDTGSNESHHKPTKQAAGLTQQREDTFDYQTAKRLAEFLVLELVMEEIEAGECVWEYFDRVSDVDEEDLGASTTNSDQLDGESDAEGLDEEAEEVDEEAEEVETETGSSMLRVYRDTKAGGQPNFYMYKSRSVHKEVTTLDKGAIAFLLDLQEKVQEHLPGYNLPIYTEHKRDGQVFRGHPNYRGLGSWRDWVVVDWGAGYRQLPCNIWCFVDLSAINLPSWVDHGGIRFKKGVFAIVEAAKYDEDEDEINRSDLFAPLLLEVGGMDDRTGSVTHRKFYLADTEAFIEPCCVIPDVGGVNNRYFKVQSRDEWPQTFVQWLRQQHKYDNMAEDSDNSDED